MELSSLVCRLISDLLLKPDRAKLLAMDGSKHPPKF
jgi:hypothetical protein